MKNAKKFIKENYLFLCGMICLLVANIPNLYASLALGEPPYMGYILLIEMGLVFYLLDALIKKRPPIFVIAGVLNVTLNGAVLIVSLIHFVGG